jgi:[acyl-carrier-protein] S-malonyltransferase
MDKIVNHATKTHGKEVNCSAPHNFTKAQPIAIFFPGQGATHISMGKDFYDSCSIARSVFEKAFSLVTNMSKSNDLQILMFEGPAEILMKTQHSQLATFITSIAIYHSFLARLPANAKIKLFAGHSLGEYTALCASGALSFEDTIKLLISRGTIMSQVINGSMVVILGSTFEKVEDIIATSLKVEQSEQIAQNNFTPLCYIANDNCEGQIVVSGNELGIRMVSEYCTKNSIKNIQLNVSGPFHSPLMSDAQSQMNKIIDTIAINNCNIGCISSVDPDRLITNSNSIRKAMYKQMAFPVRWREIMNNVYDGHNEDLQLEENREDKMKSLYTCFEIGASTVLTGLAKKSGYKCTAVNKFEILNSINFDLFNNLTK